MEPEYLAAHAQEHRDRPNTVYNSKLHVTRFMDWRQGRELTPALLQDYHTQLALSPFYKRNSTRNLAGACVKAMLHWCRKRGTLALTTDQITESLPTFKKEKKLPVVWSVGQIAKLAEACKPYRTGRTVLALLVTGCRREELLSMDESNVTEQGLKIIGTKTRTERMMPWSLLGDARTLFTDFPFRWLPHEWKTIRKAAGIEGPIKSTRSTMATFMISSGQVSAYACAKLLGHSIAIAEITYWGAPIFGITGKTIPEWMGLTLQSSNARISTSSSQAINSEIVA